MTDIPIIFSAPMVLALLREARNPGTGKTMTRRMAWQNNDRGRITKGHQSSTPWQKVKPGDRLWVREGLWRDGETWRYQADKDAVTSNQPRVYQQKRDAAPSIHMPRWASRLTLIVGAVKMEPLQAISKADVIAEGITERDGRPLADVHTGWHEPFAALWEKLHGPGSWDANPEVVATAFRPVLANIDAAEARAA